MKQLGKALSLLLTEIYFIGLLDWLFSKILKITKLVVYWENGDPVRHSSGENSFLKYFSYVIYRLTEARTPQI